MLTSRSLACLLASSALTGALLAPLPAAARAAAPSAGPSVAAEPSDTPRVLAISVDGLKPSAIRQLGRDGAPTLHRLLGEGASTLNARSAVEQTTTLPNHTSMLTGRRINRNQGGHGVVRNDDLPGSTVHGFADEQVESILSVAAQVGSTAVFATKSKFALFERSWDTERFVVDEDQTRLARKARNDLSIPRAFTFVHFSLPDLDGHKYGFTSPGYLDAVRRTDALLRKLVNEIRADVALSRDVTVVLTADHGGSGDGHSDPTKLSSYRVPFLAWGAGVTPGGLYSMNADYANPGRTRPSYDGPQPIRNGDLANLSADLLGLEAVPGSQIGTAQSLDVN